MADLKTSWPYIRYMTIAEKAAYVSDLPKNLDTLEVRPIKASPLFTVEAVEDDFVKPLFSTELAHEHQKGQANGLIWASLYITVLGLGTYSMSKWYHTDGIRNFVQFRSESSIAYLRRRMWPCLAVAWTVGHWLSDSQFTTSYPEVFS